MPDWRVNHLEGIYKFGAAYPLQKRYQILSDYATSGSIAFSARENRVCYNTARTICNKFIASGDCQPGGRGRPARKLEPYMAAYLEVMLYVDPFLYMEEIQQKLRTDLTLLPHEVPSIPVICRTLHDLNLTKHKSTKVPQERFTPYNMARRQAFVQWRNRQDPRKLFFGDETAFNKLTDVRTSGWCSVGDVLPSVEPKRDVREKISAFAVVGYNEGVVNCYPVAGSFNALSITNAIEHHFLPFLPEDSFLILDNASVHNDAAVQNVLSRKNITLVKMPTYSFDLNPIESVFSIVKAKALRNPGAIRANGMVSIVNAFAGVTIPVVQSFYRRSWQVQF